MGIATRSSLRADLEALGVPAPEMVTIGMAWLESRFRG